MKYKIGEFSKINMITVKTLRHYEEIGLLLPDEVDEWTGYRMYSSEQLVKLSQILEYKQMGFSLDEVKKIVNYENFLGRVSPELEDLLSQKYQELTFSKKDIENKIYALIEFRKQIKGEMKMEKVMIKSLPEVIVASYRSVIKNYSDLNELMPNVLGKEMAKLGCVCSQPEYCFNVYHDGEFREKDIDAEICQAVTEMKTDTGIIKFKKLATIPMAVCMYHRGSYNNFGQTYGKIFEYIDKNGYEPTECPRESYIDGVWNKESEEEWLSEIQVPVRKK